MSEAAAVLGRGLPRLSLRWRVATALGAVTLLLTSVLAVATWKLTSNYLVDQRQQSAVQQATVNVRLVQEALRTGSGGLDELLTGLTTDPDSSILLHLPGRWVTSGLQVDPAEVPAGLLALARHGTGATQRVRITGRPVLAVVLPVGVGTDFYVQLFALSQLDATLHFLSALLVTGAVLAGLFGVVLGVWASRRALRPLRELTAAASRIAAGDLGARLPQQADRDLVSLAETFNSTATQLEQRVRRDARFAADVSHELRSPLTTMVNAAAVLHRHRGEFTGSVVPALDLLTSVVHGFQRTVVDLLEISRADEDADELAREPVDLAEVVHDVLAIRPNTRRVVDAEPSLPLVWADPRKLDRVVANLVDNAESHGGGVVRIGVRAHDGGVVVEVEDAGPGVPVELRERIFERFARGTLSGNRGMRTGSGLGLAIVAQHVAGHGGSVWVEDRPGGGARFVVRLPAEQQ